MKRRRTLIYALPFFVMVFIFIQSALPDSLSGRESGLVVSLLLKFVEANPDKLSFIVRKCSHFLEFLLLGATLVPAVRQWRSGRLERSSGRLHGGRLESLSEARSRRGAVIGAGMSWLIGTVYAMTDEFHQMFVAGRSCELRDVMIDSAGVLCGVLIIASVHRLRSAEPARS